MIKRFLRYTALSTALFYNACIPPEKDSAEDDLESSCQGEVLFEDEFDGSELNFDKWEPEVCGAEANYRLREGILELNVGNGNCGLNSRSTYTLDDRTLCFEARWKVREREGVFFNNGLASKEGGIGYSLLNSAVGYGNSNQECEGEEREFPEINPESFNRYTLKVNSNEAEFFINENNVGNVNRCIPYDIRLIIDHACQSEDDTEKICEIDYDRLSEQ